MSIQSTRIVAPALIAALAALSAVYLHSKSLVVSPSKPLPSMHTVCIGRMLIDLPEDLELKGDAELYYGLTRDFKKVKFETIHSHADLKAYEAAVARRVAELTQDYEHKTPSKNRLAKSQRIDDQTTLIRAHEEPVMQGYFVAEVLLRRGHSIARLTRAVHKSENPEDIESKLLDTVRHITAIDDPRRAGKGTCLGGLLIDGGQDGEVFMVSARSTRFPDLTVGMVIDSLIAKDDGGLLKRVDQKADMLAALGATGTTLRRERSVLAGRTAEQLVETGREHGKEVRLFSVETLLNKPSTFAEPQIHFDMSMGGQIPSGDYVDPSLPQADSMALWDAIIKSIRPRPGAI